MLNYLSMSIHIHILCPPTTIILLYYYYYYYYYYYFYYFTATAITTIHIIHSVSICQEVSHSFPGFDARVADQTRPRTAAQSFRATCHGPPGPPGPPGPLRRGMRGTMGYSIVPGDHRAVGRWSTHNCAIIVLQYAMIMFHIFLYQPTRTISSDKSLVL